jgi:hypothetical protein
MGSQVECLNGCLEAVEQMTPDQGLKIALWFCFGFVIVALACRVACR